MTRATAGTDKAIEPLAFSVSDASKALGLGTTKLYEEIGAGRLRTVTVGTRRLVTRAALDEYVALLEHEAAGGIA